MTQAEQLVRALRIHDPMTYGELEALRISTAPWKRLAEPAALKALRKNETIDRTTGADKLVRFRVRGVKVKA